MKSTVGSTMQYQLEGVACSTAAGSAKAVAAAKPGTKEKAEATAAAAAGSAVPPSAAKLVLASRIPASIVSAKRLAIATLSGTLNHTW